MPAYIARRVLYMLMILLMVSVVGFVLIQLPPGDYLTTLIQGLKSRGVQVDAAMIRSLEQYYGLDQPIYTQYARWMWNMLHGDFGRSFQWNKPVSALIAERLPLTVAISLLTLAFVYAVAVPIGIYSATHQYSFVDYSFTVFGVCRVGDSELPPGADPAVSRLQVFRSQCRRPVLGGIPDPVLEPGQGHRHAETPPRSPSSSSGPPALPGSFGSCAPACWMN